MMLTVPTRTMNDGHTLPAIGLGTFSLTGEDGIRAMVSAIESGYRLIDTAVSYENEVEVGEAVRRSAIDRADLRIESKIRGSDHAYADAVRSVHESLERLRLDYIDLYLIHWPNPRQGKYLEAWRALVDLREQGLVRSIGVSNFSESHLDSIIEESGVVPAVNEIELHPYFPQFEMQRVNERHGILTEAWSPLGKHSAPFSEEAVLRTAHQLEVAPAQVVLRWHLQMGTVPIPKSADRERQRQNLDVFSFELTDPMMVAIGGLGRDDGRWFDGDPDTHEEM